MRLFISINFDDNTKDHIEEVQKNLRAYGRGNFTSRSNMHLTLAFLGEIPEDRIPDIKDAMDALVFPKLNLVFSHTGCFRKDSELWWIGIKDNPALLELQGRLTELLTEKGFKLEDRKFKPHITLAREMHAGRIDSRDLLSRPFSCKADAVSLMLSHRPNGKLTYTELYKVMAGE